MQLGPSVPQPPEDMLLILVADGPYLGTICCFIKCIWENLEFAFYGVKYGQNPILIDNVQAFTFIQLIILSSISDARLP